MYIVEKIGELILITIENEILFDEISNIKKKLEQLASIAKTDVVVSIYHTEKKKRKKTKIEKEINELLKYCNTLGLRVYSYKCK